MPGPMGVGSDGRTLHLPGMFIIQTTYCDFLVDIIIIS